MKSKFEHGTNRVYVEVFRCNKCGEDLPLNSPEVNVELFHMPLKPNRCGSKVRVVRRYECSLTMGKSNRTLDKIREILNMNIADFLNMEVVVEGGNIHLLKPEGKVKNAT